MISIPVGLAFHPFGGGHTAAREVLDLERKSEAGATGATTEHVEVGAVHAELLGEGLARRAGSIDPA